LRVLITGVKGFVGSNLSLYLEGRGYEIIGCDISPSQVQGDVTDEAFVLERLGSLDFDAVVHLAAMANVGESIKDPYRCFKINDLGTLNMLELACRKGVERFLYASSSNVYGVPVELPVKETTPFNPRTPYDQSKVAGEAMVVGYYRAKGLPITILRSWKLFGAHDAPSAAIPRFIQACFSNDPLTLYNAGRDITDPTHIENYCRAVELCLTKEEAVGEAFNIGTGRYKSIREIAETIKRLTGSSSEIKLLPPRSKLEETPMKSYPSIQKIQDILGYRVSIDFEEGIKRTIGWFSQRR
jgi:nucleoside-diphosphate-sugar epimerase